MLPPHLRLHFISLEEPEDNKNKTIVSAVGFYNGFYNIRLLYLVISPVVYGVFQPYASVLLFFNDFYVVCRIYLNNSSRRHIQNSLHSFGKCKIDSINSVSLFIVESD